MKWRIAVEPFTRPLFFAYSRLTRGMTLGVRVMAQDEQNRICLIRHTYVPGWWLPGGGVDRGETTQAAAIRELKEEAGLVAMSEPRLLSIHSNERFFRGDHILVYRIEAFERGVAASQGEIAEVGWFAADELPSDINRGCRARLAEILEDRRPDPIW